MKKDKIEIQDLRDALATNKLYTPEKFARTVHNVVSRHMKVGADIVLTARRGKSVNARKIICLIIKETLGVSHCGVSRVWRGEETKKKGWVIQRMMKGAAELAGDPEFNPTFQEIMQHLYQIINLHNEPKSNDEWVNRMSVMLDEYEKKTPEWWRIKLAISEGPEKMEQVYDAILMETT